MKEYKPRIADQILAEKLDIAGSVLIEGPKYCGKTTTENTLYAYINALKKYL
jgi:Tfp pilus assembly pilus retraction ATPase PilT